MRSIQGFRSWTCTACSDAAYGSVGAELGTGRADFDRSTNDAVNTPFGTKRAKLRTVGIVRSQPSAEAGYGGPYAHSARLPVGAPNATGIKNPAAARGYVLCRMLVNILGLRWRSGRDSNPRPPA